MFEMNAKQQAAFKAASDGVSATAFCHLILFFIGVITTVWLVLVFMGTMKNKTRNVYDSLYEFAFAVAVYIAIGTVIYFT